MTAENPNSLPKQEAIEQLRKTVGELENIIEQLEGTSLADVPSSSAIQNLIKTTDELEKTISTPSSVEKEEFIQPETVKLARSLAPNGDAGSLVKKEVIENTLQETVTAEGSQPQAPPLQGGERLTEQPKIEIEPIAKIAPESKTEKVLSPPTNEPKQNKNKWIIIGVTAALILTIIPLSWKFLLSERVPQLIARDTSETIVIPNTEIADRAAPRLRQDRELEIIPPEPEIIESDDLEPIPEVPIVEVIEPEIELNSAIPSELEIENRPQKVAIETVKTNKNLSPEQNLIAAIEEKENRIADRYSEDLVIAIAPNFTNNLVTVTLDDEWYQLAASRQDKITAEMLKRSRQLEFNKLKITDTQNREIARSPVVGDNIVILRRTADLS